MNNNKFTSLALFTITTLTHLSLLIADQTFLANWMGEMMPAIQNLTILDLCLPGTHDTMSYDLSTTVSAGGLDGEATLVWILETFPEVMPEEWIRKQSQTQGLTIQQQLENGIRFLDIRIMFTSNNWYCLHCMQTNQPAMFYLKQIKDWLVTHPTEIIVVVFTKHGGMCDQGNAQYPNVPAAIKHAFWNQITELFAGLMFDASQSALNTTTISNMISRNQRAIFFASDFVEFTNSSNYAIDACAYIDNILGGSQITNVPESNSFLTDLFTNGSTIMPEAKSKSIFMLSSLSSSSPELQLKYAFEIDYIPVDKEKHREACAGIFVFENVTDWCPPTLLDICQDMNFYNQFALFAAHKNSWRLPNAIYLDALDEDGTVRVGTSVLNPLFLNSVTATSASLPVKQRSPPLVSRRRQQQSLEQQQQQQPEQQQQQPEQQQQQPEQQQQQPEQQQRVARQSQSFQSSSLTGDDEHTTTKTAYVDLLLYHNLRQGCGSNTMHSNHNQNDHSGPAIVNPRTKIAKLEGITTALPPSSSGGDLSVLCVNMSQMLQARIAKYPMTVWDDFANARVSRLLPSSANSSN